MNLFNSLDSKDPKVLTTLINSVREYFHESIEFLTKIQYEGDFNKAKLVLSYLWVESDMLDFYIVSLLNQFKLDFTDISFDSDILRGVDYVEDKVEFNCSWDLKWDFGKSISILFITDSLEYVPTMLMRTSDTNKSIQITPDGFLRNLYENFANCFLIESEKKSS